MLMQQRLPQPYRPEADIVAERLRSLQGKLDWAAAAQVAAPGCKPCVSTRRRFGPWKACCRNTRSPAPRAWP